MPNHIIKIENLSKRYTIGHQQAKDDGLRHSLESAVRSPIQWFRTRQRRKIQEVDFWALRDVSFEIKEGEVLGIIGRNGAGKSTLLKLLSRITTPTQGRICIDGRVASLLEVGTGFHKELTGRENVFLNGAILGMSRAEITRKFDEIVDFAEIEEFIDTPVKRYSSGMYVRLAFAVAAHLEPEILIVDEVLAVGDAAFQKKCLGKMGSFAHSGRTILFVSHNAEAVRTLCNRVIWLQEGRLHRDGDTAEIMEDYFNSLSKESSKSISNPDFGLTIEQIVLRNGRGDEVGAFFPGEDLIVEILYDAQKRIEKPSLALGVLGINGSCFAANMQLDGNRPEFLEGRGKIACTFRSIPLLPQSYTIKMLVRAENMYDTILPFQDIAQFSVIGDLADYGYKGDFLKWVRYSTSVVVPYEWQLPDSSTASVDLIRRSNPVPNEIVHAEVETEPR